MKTLKDVLDFVFVAIDLPLELEKTRQNFLQAHKCLNNYLQTCIGPDDSIREAQNKIDKKFYIRVLKKVIQTLIGIWVRNYMN